MTALHSPARPAAHTLGGAARAAVPLAGSRLLSVASAQPAGARSAESLGRPFDRPGSWVHARTGIDEVRRVGPDETAATLADSAAREALRRAGLGPEDVDLVISASCSVPAPGTDRMAALAAPRAARMTINSACSGFCHAVATADGLIRTGAARTVLIIAVEQMSSLLDETDLGTSIIFGDGAGAAVLGRVPGEQAGVGPVVSGSDGARHDLIACDDGGLLRMQGREVFRWAVESLPDLLLDTVRRAGLALADIAALVPHQANRRIIDAVVTRLGIAADLTGDRAGCRVATDISRSGNTSAASIPIALDRLMHDHPGLGGRHALLFGFGAGLAYAGQVVRLP